MIAARALKVLVPGVHMKERDQMGHESPHTANPGPLLCIVLRRRIDLILRAACAEDSHMRVLIKVKPGYNCFLHL